MNLEELKGYILTEIEKFNSSRENLIKIREQFFLFREAIDFLFANRTLESFLSVFEQFEFNMSYDKLRDAIGIINWCNENNITDIKQYKAANDDLNNLKEQINSILMKIDEKIQIIDSNQRQIELFKEVLMLLDNNNQNSLFTDEEIAKIFNVIKILPFDILKKYDLIYTITNKNVENKVLSKIDDDPEDLIQSHIEENIEQINELLNLHNESDDKFIVEETEKNNNEDEFTKESNDPIFAKVQEIVNRLSKYYEIQQFNEITNETSILERKQIYSCNNEISKYNWPLIYMDLCSYLIPMYNNGENKEQIKEIFEFIIDKYTNYESICADLEDEEIVKIENYVTKIIKVDREKIERLYINLNQLLDAKLECDNICQILGENLGYTNEEIIFYYTIFKLSDDYKTYKEYRAQEIENRFSPFLVLWIEELENLKVSIRDNLEKLSILYDIIESSKSFNDDQKEIEVRSLEANELNNLMIFMPNEKGEVDFINIVDSIMLQGNNQITLRNVLNVILSKHFLINNYIGIPKNKYTGYFPLKPNDDNRNLRLFDMFRSRKGDIRCVYLTVHMSEYNRKILQNYYSNFNGVLFLVTNIFYKASDSTEYVKVTNKYIGRNVKEIKGIINLFESDFKTQEDINRALAFIDESFSQYNRACSYINEKKVGGK